MARKENAKNIGKETKKRASRMARAQAQAQAKKKRATPREYFRGVRQELKKVVWPTPKELGSYTVVVLVTCAVFALIFWGMDSGFLALLRAVLNINI